MTADIIRLIIADDHPVYRDGLARLLTEIGGFDVVGLAADGNEAVELTSALAPDIVAMDVRMPNLDGIEATRRITSSSPTTGVVVLSMEDPDVEVAPGRFVQATITAASEYDLVGAVGAQA